MPPWGNGCLFGFLKCPAKTKKHQHCFPRRFITTEDAFYKNGIVWLVMSAEASNVYDSFYTISILFPIYLSSYLGMSNLNIQHGIVCKSCSEERWCVFQTTGFESRSVLPNHLSPSIRNGQRSNGCPENRDYTSSEFGNASGFAISGRPTFARAAFQCHFRSPPRLFALSFLVGLK